MENNKRQRTEAVVFNLPDDVIVEIISRVHVKDLMRFKCVSKSWFSLIDSDSHLSFLQLHRAAQTDRPLAFMQKAKSHSSNKGVYRNRNGIYAPKIHNYRFSLDSLEDQNTGLVEIHNPFDQDDHAGRRDIDGSVVASLDGLLVLQQWDTYALALLNPSTGKSHIVPPNPAGDRNVVFSGIGYDYGRACYKLVTIIRGTYTLMIYDVNHECRWRKVKFRSQTYGIKTDSLYYSSGRYVNNVLYWSADYANDSEEEEDDDDSEEDDSEEEEDDDDSEEDDSEEKEEDDDSEEDDSEKEEEDGDDDSEEDNSEEAEAILGFDIDKEEFFKPKLPDFGDTLFKFSGIVSFDEKLCLVCRWKKTDETWTRVGREKERVDIWVMNETYDEDMEDRSSSCWVKLFSISNPRAKLKKKKLDPFDYDDYMPLLTPKFYSACRNKVLFSVQFERLVWYNIEKEEFERFRNPIKDNMGNTAVITCMPSLIGNGVF